MKTLKILFYTTISALIIGIFFELVWIFSYVILGENIFNLPFAINSKQPSIFFVSFFIFRVTISIILIFGIKYLIRIFKNLSLGSYYPLNSIEYYKKSGYIFSICGLLGFLSSFSIILVNIGLVDVEFNNLQFLNSGSRSLNLLLIVLGLFLLIISQLHKSYLELKQENDLTI